MSEQDTLPAADAPAEPAATAEVTGVVITRTRVAVEVLKDGATIILQAGGRTPLPFDEFQASALHAALGRALGK